MSLRDWLNIATLATPATLPVLERATVATVANVARVVESLPNAGRPAQAASDQTIDPGVARRRAKALAMLAEEPSRRIAVVAECPAPGEVLAHVCVAVRGVAVVDFEIPGAKYDAFAVLALMQSHGTA